MRDRSLVEVSSKGGVDLVTDVDKARSACGMCSPVSPSAHPQACEALVLGQIRARYPAHRFIGEETASKEPLTDAPTWLVDPVDGTTNFVHAYPFCCVSIALAVDRRMQLGVVYVPALDEMYHAVRGHGAFLNDVRIRVGAADALSNALVANQIGAGRDDAFVERTMKRQELLLKGGLRALRASGSCAINMCHVARGILDCYYEYGVGGPWDMAAGQVVVEEAGGVVRDPASGDVFDLFSRRLICGNATVCEKVGEVLRRVSEPAE